MKLRIKAEMYREYGAVVVQERLLIMWRTVARFPILENECRWAFRSATLFKEMFEQLKDKETKQ